MWIVKLALRRPYTVAVMSFLILLLGILSLSRMVVDIFPTIDIPVVAVIWAYPGLPAEDMERRVVLISERAFSTTVNGIERIESQSIPGVGILHVYFQPGADIGAAIAQISAVTETILRITPPGMTPPNIIQFNASNVPVAQLTVSSKTMPEEKVFDYGLNFIRIKLFTIPGLSTPAPFGGKTRQIMVDVNPEALAAKGLSTGDVVNALQTSNVILPAGVARIGTLEYNVVLNSSPESVKGFDSIPIKVVGGQPVLLGDVAHTSDSYVDQTNIVHVNGVRATYLAILKHADASTLAVVESTKKALPQIKAVAPDGLELKIDFDQSLFVRASINGVLREAIVSSLLVSIMIFAFLGSWRSMVIVCSSIPLAILTSIIVLNLSGNTVNIMTLGGLSLAIGMLVDDATVEVENIHRNRGLGKPLTVAILDGASQIATPAIVATLAICIVFFPVVLLVGPAKFLFTPLALAVVCAMLASYILSRTLVPTLARMLMASEKHAPGHGEQAENPASHPANPAAPDPRLQHLAHDEKDAAPPTWMEKANAWRDRHFENFQNNYYGRLLELCLHNRALVLVLLGGLVVITGGIMTIVGTDFFPKVDAGLMKLHFRAPAGTRIEETEKLTLAVEEEIKKIIPQNEVETINDMIGLPTNFNLAFVQTDNVNSMDSEILIALKTEHHPTKDYARRIRKELPARFPGCGFYFQPADIVAQVLNFGLSSTIDVQVEGPKFDDSFALARKLRDEIMKVPGTVDVHLQQVLDYPTLKVDVDRVRAAQFGMSQRDVANAMLISLSTSGLIAPSYFLNPVNNVNYVVAVRVPVLHIDSVPALQASPLTLAAPLLQAGGSPSAVGYDQPISPAQTLGNVADVSPLSTPSSINHYTVQRVIDVDCDTDGRDLGSVSDDIEAKIKALGKLPPGVKVTVRGQPSVMRDSFRSLGLGLVLAIVLVYLLIVVLFQSWVDPFIILMAVPGALVGILWMLVMTGTTINVESMMGSIMAVGIAVSNSILLVSFANEVRVEKGLDPMAAALEAGKTRLRPVIMTALAMILGMLPMALALGEGGEQNAPLGRAVVGGLLFCTVVTLFIVPVVYSLLRQAPPTLHMLEDRFLAEERGEAGPGTDDPDHTKQHQQATGDHS